MVHLVELRGRPVVIEFGSFTCHIFAVYLPKMEELAQQFPEAAFLLVYTGVLHRRDGCAGQFLGIPYTWLAPRVARELANAEASKQVGLPTQMELTNASRR